MNPTDPTPTPATPSPDVSKPETIVGRRWLRMDGGRKRFTHVLAPPAQLKSGQFFDGSYRTGLNSYIDPEALAKLVTEAVESPPGTDPDDYTCVECGEIHTPHQWSTGAKLAARGLCHFCAFWTDAYLRVQSGRSIVVGGNCYSIAEEPKPGERGFFGHGGSLFRIEYPDGRIVESRNLWHNGDVPPRWRERLPDNARFLPRDPPPAGFDERHEGYVTKIVPSV